MSDYPTIAMNYFKQGYNCAQSVVAAFAEKLGADAEIIIKMSSSFGGGMGRLREVCGAVTGMFIVAGALYGYENPVDKIEKTSHYRRIQELASEFKKRTGSIVCRDLLGLGKGIDTPEPEDRTKEYYAKRPCVQIVGMAAEIIEDLINRMEETKNENSNSL